jgi:hypothetical protein
MDKGKSNLAYLMSVFKISSNELAAKLNVHYTLVSKWKNDKRPLTKKTEYTGHIVDIFLAMDKPRQYFRIKGILSDCFPNIPLNDPATLENCLKSWLVKQYDSVPVMNYNIEDVGNHAVFDMYFGHEGKENGISRLIDNAIALPPGQHLCIWKNQRMHSILEHWEFMPGKYRKYREIINRGGTITVVHALNRKPQETFYSVLEMLPLHTTGKTEAYCEHNYSDSPVKYSIYLLENVAACFSIEFDNNKHSNTSYFITENRTVGNLKNVYDSIIKQNCSPLIDQALAADGKRFQFELAETMKKPGTTYLMTNNSIPVFMMETGRFEEVLQYNYIPERDKPELLRMHRMLYKAFLDAVDANEFRVILQSSGDPAHIPEDRYIKFGDRTLRTSTEMFFEQLETLKKLESEKPNFGFAIADNMFLPTFIGTDIMVKQGHAIVSTSNENIQSIPIVIKAPTLLDIFYYCLNHLWNSIPPNESLQKLSDLLEHSPREKASLTGRG